MKRWVQIIIVVVFCGAGKPLIFCQRVHPIMVSDASGRKDTLFLGFSVDATYCIDTVLGEYELPPVPDTCSFAARFVDSRTGSGACLGNGIEKNVHYLPYFATMWDTFKIKVVASPEQYPIRFQWDRTEFFFPEAYIKIYDGDNGNPTYSMYAESLAEVSNPTVSVASVLILNYWDFCPESSPDLFQPYVDSVTQHSAKLVCPLQFGDNNSGHWFEWGTTLSYGNVTQAKNSYMNIFSETISGLTPSTTYHFRGGVVNCRSTKTSVDATFRTSDPENVRDYKEFPLTFSLEQNYPNPFNPRTAFSFRLPVSGYATLTVYNILGMEVAILVNEFKSPGTYTIQWDATDISSGVYYYKLSVVGEDGALSYRAIKKMALTR